MAVLSPVYLALMGDLMDKPEKRVEFLMHGPDQEIIERYKKRWGCSTATAIRGCIRIADQVVMNLEKKPLTDGE